eukprot:451032_1
MTLLLTNLILILNNHCNYALGLQHGHHVYISKLPKQLKEPNHYVNPIIDVFNTIRVGVISNTSVLNSTELIINQIGTQSNNTSYQLKIRKRYLNLHLIPNTLPQNSFAVVAKMSLNSKPHLCGMTVRIIGPIKNDSHGQLRYPCRVYDYKQQKFISIELKPTVLWKWPTYAINPKDLLFNHSLDVRKMMSHQLNTKIQYSFQDYELFFAEHLQFVGQNKNYPRYSNYRTLLEQFAYSISAQRDVHLPFAKKHHRKAYVKHTETMLNKYHVIESKNLSYGSVCLVLCENISVEIPTIMEYNIIFYDWNTTQWTEANVMENQLYEFPALLNIEYPMKISIEQYIQLLTTCTKELEAQFPLLHLQFGSKAAEEYFVNSRAFIKVAMIIADMFQRFGHEFGDISPIFEHFPPTARTLYGFLKNSFFPTQYKKDDYVVLAPHSTPNECVYFEAGMVQSFDKSSVSVIMIEWELSLKHKWMIFGSFVLQRTLFWKWPTGEARTKRISDDEKELVNSLVAQLLCQDPSTMLNHTKEYLVEVTGVALCQRYGVATFKNLVGECIKNWRLDKYIFFYLRSKNIHITNISQLEECKRNYEKFCKFVGQKWLYIFKQAKSQIEALHQ